MFLRNRTSHRVALSRGFVSSDVLAIAGTIERSYRIGPEGLVPLAGRAECATKLPDVTKFATWKGTSVTVSGSIWCPSSPPFSRTVELRVGDQVRRLLVTGPRRWKQSLM